jgi:hypothetical protein
MLSPLHEDRFVESVAMGAVKEDASWAVIRSSTNASTSLPTIPPTPRGSNCVLLEGLLNSGEWHRRSPEHRYPLSDAGLTKYSSAGKEEDLEHPRFLVRIR